MPLRSYIRKSINTIFFRFIYETKRHNGIAELLEILGSIINGFALPLKDEHKQFLIKALLPLHKVHYVSFFHQQLSYCVTQFVDKHNDLSKEVLGHILAYWPVIHSAKEVLFLNEVEEILEMMQQDEGERVFGEICVPLFKRIALCLSSPHFQVAERALFLWNNEHVVHLVQLQRHQLFPVVFQALRGNMKVHWNSTVTGLTQNVLKLFEEIDAELYKKVLDEEDSKKLKESRDAKWSKIVDLARASEGYKNAGADLKLLADPDLKLRRDGLPDRNDDSGADQLRDGITNLSLTAGAAQNS